jgi:branched-chain amino acid transport system permease protein
VGSLIVTAILRGGLYALMAIGLSVVFGVMNISNFAHGEFYMLGAYFAYFGYTTFGLNPLLSMLFGAICGFIVGVIVEKIMFTPLRMRGSKNWIMNTFLLTLGLSLILKNGAKLIWGNTYRGITSYFDGSVNLGVMTVTMDRVVALAIAVVSITAFMLFMNYTRTGRAIRAVSMDATGASIVGVNLSGIYTLTFGLSAGLAALAGGALLSITPASPEMGLSPLYKSWFVLILIGMGNIGGSIVGGLIVGALEAASTYYIGASWQDVFSLSIIILILLIKPNGIFGKNTKKV